MIKPKKNEELKGSDKTLPKLSLHVDKSTGEGFAVDGNGKIVGRDAATGLSEATVTAKRTWLNKFKKEHPEMAEIWRQMAQDNLQQKSQAGFYDASYKPTTPKEEAERDKRNYFEVAALNAAMGSPYTMNQNSFNYNPTIANQQSHFGASYPLSSINFAFQGALGDAALDYGLKWAGRKAMPIIASRMLNNASKNWDGTVGYEYFNDPYSWYRITNSTEPAGIAEMGAQFTTTDIPEYAMTDRWRRSMNELDRIARVKSDGIYVLGNNQRKISFISNGRAHGNTSQAAKGKPWEGSVANSPFFKQGILEGYGPVTVPQGRTTSGLDSRSHFIPTPWEEVPTGARIGFHSGEMPLGGLRWFERLPNYRYKYQGEVVPEHRVWVNMSDLK